MTGAAPVLMLAVVRLMLHQFQADPTTLPPDAALFTAHARRQLAPPECRALAVLLRQMALTLD